jgi:hypothetical protein
MSEKRVTLAMLDEVTHDMRLEWPAQRITRERLFDDQAFPRKVAGRRE